MSTPNSSTNSPVLPPASSSRRATHNEISHTQQEHHQYFAEPSPAVQLRSTDTQLPPGEGGSFHNTTHIRPEQDQTERRPSKRLRRQKVQSTMKRERVSPPPSDTSSQSSPDNETEAERSQQSELSTTNPAPPKKKRTRTLTTPQQASVLHALLEKSRFPTTAMREDVGRQIGLSARKVQIWFQNQRQKARRPRSEGPATSTHPPQYGPFQNVPVPTPLETASSLEQLHGAFPTSTRLSSITGPSGTRTLSADRPGYEDSQRRSHDANSQLLGPGVPGWDPGYPSSPSTGEHDQILLDRSPDRLISPDSYIPRAADTFQSMSAPLRNRLLAPRPLRPLAVDDAFEGLHRALPPLDFRGTQPLRAIPNALPASHPTVLSHGSVTQYQTPPSHHGRMTPVVIPPPFALEPQPRWDPRSFSPFSRPEFTSWSSGPRSSLSPAKSFSATTTSAASRGISSQIPPGPVIPASSSHSGRFDPVRAVASYERKEVPRTPPSTDAFRSDDDD